MDSNLQAVKTAEAGRNRAGSALAGRTKTLIPIGVSNRHAHLSQEHWDILFGGPSPRKFRPVRQPGFYACYETVDIEGPKGRISNVRLIAPHRPKTQIEISKTDAAMLGVRPPVRDSGVLEGAAPVRIIGPKASIDVRDGLVIAKRHIHFSPDEARAMGVREGDLVRARVGSGEARELVFGQILVRVSDQFSLELHIDSDEANAAGVKTGDFATLVE